MRWGIPWLGTQKKRREGKKDSELLTKLNGFIAASRDALTKTHAAWNLADEYIDGKHLINRNVPNAGEDIAKADRDKKPINYIRPVIESMIPMIGDADMQPIVLDDMDTENATNAEQITNYMQAYWRYTGVDITITEVSRDLLAYGSGYMKVYWNKYMHPVSVGGETLSINTDQDPNFEGGMVTSLLNEELDGELGGTAMPHEDTPKPPASNGKEPPIEDDVETVGKYHYNGDVVMEWCDPFSVFPDVRAKRLERCEYVALRTEMPESAFEAQFGSLEGAQGANSAAYSMDNQSKGVMSRLRPRNEGGEATSSVVVWEVYHEWGRRLTVFSGSSILFDGDNPTPGGKFPVVLVANTKRGGDLLGHSEVDDLIAVQDFINLVNYRIARNQRMTANVRAVTNDKSLREIDNREGAIVHVQPTVGRNIAGYLNWDYPPPIAVGVFQWLNFLLESFDTLSGVHEITQGKKPKGVTSGLALTVLSEEAQARVREVFRHMTKGVEDAAQLMLALMHKYYAENRQLVYYDQAEGERNSTVLEASMLRNVVRGGDEDMAFTVVMESRGDLPNTPAGRYEMAVDLQSRGITDAQDVLEKIRWPKMKHILTRMEAAAEAEAQAQMAMQQQAQGMPQEGAPQDGAVNPIDELMGMLSPEQIDMLEVILPKILNGEEPTPDEIEWLQSLPDEAKDIIEALMQSVTSGGQDGVPQQGAGQALPGQAG